MNETMQKLANDNEHFLEKLYIAVSIEALALEIPLVSIIFYYLGMTTFAVLQAIGSTLMILLVGSGILHFRKNHLKKRVIAALHENNIPEDTFHAFLKTPECNCEFLLALFTPPNNDQKSSDSPTP